MYNLNYLEAFLSLSETLSFTQTARALKMSQPSVSRQIQLLEEQLKTKLFLRDRNKVHLSQAGQVLKDSLSPLLKDLNFALSETQQNTENLHGSLTFGTLAEMGQSTFMATLLQFQKQYPEIALFVEYTTEVEIKRKLKTGALDFGTITSLEESESLRAYSLFHERVVMVTRTANSRTVTTDEETDFILYRKNDPLYERYFKVHGKKLAFKNRRTYIVVNSHRSMLEALLNSDSYAVLPYLSAKPLIAQGKLKIVSELELKNPVYLAVIENKHPDRRTTIFRKHILSFCRELENIRGHDE